MTSARPEWLVVGSSPDVCVGPPLGHLVECLGLRVARLNEQPTVGYEAQVGTRTDIRVVNGVVAEKYAEALAKSATLPGLPGLPLLAIPPTSQHTSLGDRLPTLNVYPQAVPADTRGWPQVATTGLATIAFLLGFCPRVVILGFSFGIAHYFEENEHPGTSHDYVAERRIVADWIAAGRVVELGALQQRPPCRPVAAASAAAKHLEDVCFIVQARLGSMRCPRKMLRDFCGTTLTDIVLDKVLASSLVPREQFYFAVGEPELAAKATSRGLQVFWRSEGSVSAEADIQAIYEWHDKLPYRWWVMINGCQPFLRVETIDAFVRAFLADETSSGSFGVLRRKDYYWNADHELVTPWPTGQTILNTKAVEATFQAAHSLYAGKMSDIAKDQHMGSFRGPGDPKLFELADELEVWDIDFEWEWAMACALARQGGAPGITHGQGKCADPPQDSGQDGEP